MSTKEVLIVTGATGLLGRYLIRRLAPRNEVHVIARQAPIDVIPSVRYHLIDLGSEWDIGQLPLHADKVIHLAQSSHYRNVPAKAIDVFNVNLVTTAKLLDYAWRAGAGQFLFASSGGIYGAGSQAFDENSPIVPPGQLGYYLGTKLGGEVLAQSYAAYMQVVVLRFFFVYGPGQNRGMLIPRLMDNVVAGRPITLHGPDGIRINPIYVTDATQALTAALDTRESAIYNVAGSEVLSLRSIAETIGVAVGRAPIFDLSAQSAQDLVADNQAMREALHKPGIDFRAGISRMARRDAADAA